MYVNVTNVHFANILQKSMAELEAKVSENVIEACTRTGSVRKCVFTSSLLACALKDNSLNDFDHSIINSIINEESWSDEQLCVHNKVKENHSFSILLLLFHDNVFYGSTITNAIIV